MTNTTDLVRTRPFHLGDLLSASTGALVSPRHMDGLYDLFGWIMQDDGITMIGLMCLADTVEAEVKSQFPALAGVKAPKFAELFSAAGVGRDDRSDEAEQTRKRIMGAWIASVADEHFGGEVMFNVSPKSDTEIPQDARDNLNDVFDGFARRGVPVIVVEVGDDGPPRA